MRIPFRLAWRDLRGHKVMTTLAILLLAVTVGFVSFFIVWRAATPSSMQLKQDGLQARIYLTDTGPIAQNTSGSVSGPQNLDANTMPSTDYPAYMNESVLDTVGEIVAPNVASFREDGVDVPELSRTGGDGYYYHDGVLTPKNQAMLVDGRLPQKVEDTSSPREIALDRKAMVATGAHIGDTLYSPDYSSGVGGDFIPYVVVGEIETGISLDEEAESESSVTFRDMLTTSAYSSVEVRGDAPVTWAQIKELNEYGLLVQSLYVIANPPAENEQYAAELVGGDAVDISYHTAVSALTAVGILEVIFIISPSFTIAAKRNERMLAQLSAVGAIPKTLAAIMLWEGLIIGVAGAVLGLVLNLVLTIALGGITSIPTSFDFSMVVAVLCVTVLLGLLAALIPAVVASRVNVVKVLSARNDFRKVSIRLGVIPFVIGIASAVVTPLMLESDRNWSTPWIPIIVAVGLIALAAAAPVFVMVVAKIFGRTPASRLAARNLARNMNRSGAAVAGITLVTVGGMLAGTIGLSTLTDGMLQRVAFSPEGGARIELTAQQAGGDLREVYDLTLERINEVRPIASADPIRTADFGQATYLTGNRDMDVEPEWNQWGEDVTAIGLNGMILSREEVDAINLLDDADRALAGKVLAAGGVLVQKSDPSTALNVMHWDRDTDATTTLTSIELDDYTEADAAASAAGVGGGYTQNRTVAVIVNKIDAEDSVPVARVLPYQGVVSYILSPAAAEKFGGKPIVVGASVSFAEPVRWSDRDPAPALFDTVDGLAEMKIAAPRFVMLMLPLVATGIAVALTLFVAGILTLMISRAARADMDTVVAVGAPPGFRRKFSIATSFMMMAAGLLPGAVVAYYGIWLGKRYLGFVGLGYHVEIGVMLVGVLLLGAVAIGALFPPRVYSLTRRDD
ncbi:MAG: hypothetical protein PUK40_04440 [Actinomycetaceae bacterium]|nr:hypothetical protein [Arcanobacterium sp.]MDD7505181.1 hypothetical protein [Actinomycetaceae bacterium]